jgi:outer membrane scaffolding protein for murein synthesis (MipA/OmpV family)
MRRALYSAICALVALIGLGVVPVAAEQGGGTPIQLSAAGNATAAATVPAADQQFEFPGLERLSLNGRQNVGANLFQFGGFRAGTIAAYAPDRQALVGTGLTGFGGGEVGTFAEYRFDAFKITANARQDTSTSHGNQSFAVGFGYGAKLASDISLAVGPNATWSTGRGSGEGPLGLSPGTFGRGAAGNGLALHDVAASVSVDWRFLDRWQLSGVAGARQLLGDAPFTNESDQGGATQLFTGVSLGYKF